MRLARIANAAIPSSPARRPRRISRLPLQHSFTFSRRWNSDDASRHDEAKEEEKLEAVSGQNEVPWVPIDYHYKPVTGEELRQLKDDRRLGTEMYSMLSRYSGETKYYNSLTTYQMDTLKANSKVLGSATSTTHNLIHTETIPLTRSLQTGRFTQHNWAWFINYATLLGRMFRQSLLVDIILPTRSRKTFAQLVHRLREEGVEHADDKIPLIRDAVADLNLVRRGRGDLLTWPGLALSIMRYMPRLVASFLKATYPLAKPPFYMIVDVIDFIARYELQAVQAQPEHQMAHENVTASQLVQTIQEIFEQCVQEKPYVSHTTIFLILTRADVESGRTLFDLLRARESYVQPLSCLQFANFFAQFGEFEKALEALNWYLDIGGDPRQGGFLGACSKTLRWSVVHPEGYHSSSYIVSRMMNFGLEIDLMFQKILLANAFDSGDQQTGLKIFSFMRESGVEPDEWTYASLLKGLRDSEDASLIAEVLRLAAAKVQETRSTWLAGEIIFYHYRQHMQRINETKLRGIKWKVRQEAWADIVPLYLWFFDPAPLVQLGLVNNSMQRQSDFEAMQPNSFVIALMMLAYFRSVGGENSGVEIFRIHTNWWDTVTKDKACVPWVKDLMIDMAVTPEVSNVCMHALGTYADSLPRAVDIMERISSRHITTPTRTIKIEGPTLYSWNILLNAFARHGQSAAAEKLITVMTQKGVAPNRISWNTLIKAHAIKGYAKGVLDAMKRKGKAGFGLDRFVQFSMRKMEPGSSQNLKALLKVEAQAWEKEERGIFEDAGIIEKVGGRRTIRSVAVKEKSVCEADDGFDMSPMGLENTDIEESRDQVGWEDPDEEEEEVSWGPNENLPEDLDETEVDIPIRKVTMGNGGPKIKKYEVVVKERKGIVR